MEEIEEKKKPTPESTPEEKPRRRRMGQRARTQSQGKSRQIDKVECVRPNPRAMGEGGGDGTKGCGEGKGGTDEPDRHPARPDTATTAATAGDDHHDDDDDWIDDDDECGR